MLSVGRNIRDRSVGNYDALREPDNGCRSFISGARRLQLLNPGPRPPAYVPSALLSDADGSGDDADDVGITAVIHQQVFHISFRLAFDTPSSATQVTPLVVPRQQRAGNVFILGRGVWVPGWGHCAGTTGAAYSTELQSLDVLRSPPSAVSVEPRSPWLPTALVHVSSDAVIDVDSVAIIWND
jgi:hypothetical protein